LGCGKPFEQSAATQVCVRQPVALPVNENEHVVTLGSGCVWPVGGPKKQVIDASVEPAYNGLLCDPVVGVQSACPDVPLPFCAWPTPVHVGSGSPFEQSDCVHVCDRSPAAAPEK
jgi:hypothetical protein